MGFESLPGSLIETVTIAEHFNGPPLTGNGGYVCGVIAKAIGPSARIGLFLPPPLEKPLTLQQTEGGTVFLRDGQAVVGEGVQGRPDVSIPPPPSLEAAAAASERFAGRDPDQHAFPSCFVCGPLRDDGLRLFPGPLDGGLACVWRPQSTDPLLVWAALDCPSGFACMPEGSASVLALMTASIEAPVVAGRDYVVSAWKLFSEGRKHRGASAIHDADGALIASAEALWITLRARTS